MLVEKFPGDIQKEYVPEYKFEMPHAASGKVMGLIGFRSVSTDKLIQFGGNIGYEVEPQFRGQRLAFRACRQLLPFAKQNGLKELWITCNPDNLPSRRTCELLGAELVEIVPLPEEHEMYQKGDRMKCRYRLGL